MVHGFSIPGQIQADVVRVRELRLIISTSTFPQTRRVLMSEYLTRNRGPYL